MAATGSKRPLPTKVAAMKQKKRRKLDPESKATTKSAAQDGQKRRTRLDALAWTNVAMPDHLDDYEGFFGLEEVDDVDVVRDKVTGALIFNARPTVQTDNDNNGHSSDSMVGNSDGDGEEWSGFSDDGGSVPVGADSSEAQAKDRRRPVHQREDKIQPSGKSPFVQLHGAFEGLRDGDDDHDDVDISAWRPLSLCAETLSSLSRMKFSSPTAIQSAAIPEVLAGHDVIGKASTGSGKTLAFGIPILEEFLERRRTGVRTKNPQSCQNLPLALILSPTRELAHQLEKHLRALCSHESFEGPSIATLTGGLSLQKQRRLLKSADLLIGTPGRLWEIISEGKGGDKPLQSIQFLVIDEADRLLSEGHFKEVEEILNSLDRRDTYDGEENQVADRGVTKDSKRQTLVFSATFDRNLQRKLSAKARLSSLESNKDSLEYLLKKLKFRNDKPKFIDVNSNRQLASGLKEGLIECSGMEKDLYLYTLLLLRSNARTLVFTNSISAVRRLTPLLQNLNLPALPLHSGMPQKARLRSVERFTAQQSNNKANGSILVATDVAARGLDIPSVQFVIHYHLPRAADTYVHRSGRTARAGKQGSSIIICAPEESAGVRRLVAKVHSTSTPDDDAGRQGFFIRTLDLDRRLVSRLRPRATLAKKIADAEVAKAKGKKEDDFLRVAAEELGVEYDSDEDAKGKRGRGKGREKKEKESKGLTKGDMGAMKAELKALLAKRVNVGVSERYLTSGGVDVEELLRQHGADGGEFLGSVDDIGL